MNFLSDLKSALALRTKTRDGENLREFGNMKNYEEFKGYRYRIDFDKVSGQFKMQPVQPAAEAINLKPIPVAPICCAEHPKNY